MSTKRVSFNQAFNRALKAASKDAPEDAATPAVVKKPPRHTRNASSEVARRFIGDCMIDLRFKRFATDSKGAVRPWYIATLSWDRASHKISLGGPSNWGQRFKTPLDDELVNEVVQYAVSFALDESDPDIPDFVTEGVKKATAKGRSKDGKYEVRWSS